MEDIRYSELLFLQKLAKDDPDFKLFRGHPDQAQLVGITPSVYADMAATLLEELFIRFHKDEEQLLVSQLRGELGQSHQPPSKFKDYEWSNPRETILSTLRYGSLYELDITYRGLRRIEELRELLRRDRILEHFGVLLDLRYVHTDLQDALRRPSDVPISVLYADLDRFKPINDKFGHAAGDVVLKAYLEVVRDSIGSAGTAYRGRGDEVVAIITGQGHGRAVQLAEKIRKAVEMIACKHDGKSLPKVTASIGVATTPPEVRTAQIESVADERNRQAKEKGRNRVVGET